MVTLGWRHRRATFTPVENRGTFLIRFIALLALLFSIPSVVRTAQLADYLECTGFSIFALVALCVLIFPRVGPVIAFAVPGIFLLYTFWIHWSDTQALRPIAQKAIQTSAAVMYQTGSLNPAARAVVWDMRKNSLSDIHYLLPKASRGQATDSALTVVLIGTVRSRKVGSYHEITYAPTPAQETPYPSRLNRGPKISTPEPSRGAKLGDGYVDTVNVAIVNWPDQTLVGWQTFESGMPPSQLSIPRRQIGTDIHGDYQRQVVGWLLSAQRLPPAPPETHPFLAAFRRATRLSPTQLSEAEARAEAVRRYPALGIADSPLNKAYVARYRYLRSAQPAYFRKPDWPMRLADELAP